MAAGPEADQTLLVLDDYHLIDSEAVHASLAFLIEHRPPGPHLVLASRSDPPLAQPACGAATSWPSCVRRICGFLSAAFSGRELRMRDYAKSVAALAGRTEVWIAGLQWRRWR